jgi:hypothetical protein
MILALAVALGFAASLARHRGRALAQISRISLRSAWLALLALVLQWPMLRTQAGPTEELAVQQALFLLSHLLLLAFVWRNRRQPAILLVGLGVTCNLLVILVNGGLMPIAPETLVRINPGIPLEEWPLGIHYGYSKDIILAKDATRLWFLSDILVLPPPFPWPTAFSLGDLVIAAGIILLLQGPARSSALPLAEAQTL